jgi:hypothetical protein
MDLEYILEQLNPLDYHKETNCLTLVFPDNVIIFLREWEDNELMWHVFDNKQHIDAGVEEEVTIVKLLKNYIKDRFAAKKNETENLNK